MFTEEYRQTFSELGIELSSGDGVPAAELDAAEVQLGITLPSALRDYYLVAGREPQINQVHNRLRLPTNWSVDADKLIFMEENQCVVYWGIDCSYKPIADSVVWQGANIRRQGIHWSEKAESDSCGTFLKVMAIWHAAFGGAVANTAVGYVDEQNTRTLFDDQWTLVGEVNKMRAYQQSGKSACFLKWEDPIQKMRNLPAWRVFVAAASPSLLEELKATVPAQWEFWGLEPPSGRTDRVRPSKRRRDE